MPDIQLLCPHCSHTELVIVGCFVYSYSGLPASTEFSHLNFDVKDRVEQQKLVRCLFCNEHSRYEDALKRKELADQALHWHTTVTGIRVPVICPVCKNMKHFVQDRRALYSEEYMFSLNADGSVESCERTDSNEEDHVVVRYRCAVSACTGVVEVNPEDTFTVTTVRAPRLT